MFGTLVKFERGKGFGFIVSDDDPLLPDIFVHFSEIQPSQYWSRKFLLPNMNLEFDLDVNPKATSDDDRLRAKNARVIAPVTIAVQRGAPKVRP